MVQENQVALDQLPATAQDVATAKLLVDIEEAEALLGFGKKKDYSVNDLLKSFEVCFQVFEENGETKKILPLTNAKNILMRHQIEQMVAENGRFDVTGMIPFEKICLSCRGTGELYKFFRRVVPTPCKFCKGEGTSIRQCISCKGTGRYKNKDCRLCNGTGKQIIKCRSCHGKGVFNKFAIDAKISSTTPCKKCEGHGFITPKPETKKQHVHTPNNPVITADLGETIKNTVVAINPK